ncbi:MAG: transcription elongation factor GreA [Clostridiales bacterium]|nr:transcription elongation factor GreA [Clostridiales bacterium]
MMANKVFKMTKEGKQALEKELEFLKNEGRIDIAEKLKVARSYGDLSENSEYDEAKSEQAKIEARIRDLEYQLENSVIVDSTTTGDKIGMGSKVKVFRKNDKSEILYEIVSYSQTDPANGKISDESLVGQALMGSKVGDTVEVEAPIGNLELEIISID